MGIAIVESAEPVWSSEGLWRVEVEPAVDIGSLEGDDSYVLSRVRSAVRLDDGRVVVADGGTNQLRYYDDRGEHLLTAGRQGDGPGEFRRLGSLAVVTGDTIAAWDSGNLRLSFFDRAGTFARSLALETGKDIHFPQFIGILNDGTIVAWATPAYVPDEDGSVTLRAPARLLAYASDGSLRDTIHTLASNEIFVRRSADETTVIDVPFGKGMASSHDGSHVWAGVTENFEVRAYDSRGPLVRIVRRIGEPRPVTRQDFDLFKKRQLEGLPPGPMRDQFEGMFDDVPVPETMPFFDRILPDPTGSLWMKRVLPPADQRTVWSVFSPHGALLGDVETPPGLTVFQIGEDFVLGRWQDDLDVEHVRLHRLERS